MTADHDYESWDAAYVLGSLTPAERRDFEDHLAACPRCRAAVAELTSLPGLLARARPLVEGSPLPPGSAVGTGVRVDDAPARSGPRPGLVAAIAAREARRVRTVRTRVVVAIAGAAAAVALALTLPGVLAPAPEPAATATLTTVELAAVGASPLTASVALERVPWGTRLTMTCDYPEADPRYGVGSNEYVLVVTDRAGRDSQVSTWSAVPGRAITLEAGTALTLDRIAAVEVRTAAGDTVLASAVDG